MKRDIELIISGQKDINKPNYIKADITKKEEVAHIVDDVDGVIHLAAMSLGDSQKNPEQGVQVNVMGSLNLLEECVKKGVKKFIFASTASVIGMSEKNCVDESVQCTPNDIYSVSKLAVEGYLKTYYETYGLKYTALRLFNVYGPNQGLKSGGLISNTISKITEGQELTIFGDGNNSRDFIYIDDVVKIITDFINTDKGIGICNLGTGKLTKIIDVINIIGEVMGKKPLIRYEPVSSPDTRSYCSDTKKLIHSIGYTPSISFREGIKKTVEGYQNR